MIFFLNFKKIEIQGNIIDIHKGSSLFEISEIILKDENILNQRMYQIFLLLWNSNIDQINYGEFDTTNQHNLINLTKLLSKPSNVYYDLTIIDGWQEYQLHQYIKKIFNEKIDLKYSDIFADTYKYQSTDSIDEIINIMKTYKKNYFEEVKKNELLKTYSIDDIMIIASLIEKEAIDDQDKRMISSVIFNRLEKNMKLQIDATTIFSLTKGKFKLKKELTFENLKNKDSYNTYYIHGLPPSPICFVNSHTIDIVLEDYESDYFFYYFDKTINKHIYSKTFNEHRNKLKNYRNNE